MSPAGTDGAGVVVVGGSVAGIRVARALREKGYTAPVCVVEAEPEVPYDKPPLSKGSLDGDVHVPLITRGEADGLDITLLLGRRAERVDTADSTVALDDGTVLPFEHLVLATGLSPRRSPYDVDGVHVLRTLSDARDLRTALAGARTALVIGAGFIGAEVAALARGHGVAVTLVDPAPVPMARVVGTALGERFGDLHRRHGVDTRFGVRVVGLTGLPGRAGVADGTGHRADLSDGTSLTVDVVVVGIGSSVNTAWLDGSGLPLDDGVVCDVHGTVIGHPQVHAVGDVARWAGDRVEHWTNAVDQAVCVAHTIVHPDAPQALVAPAYVWSDQYDWRIQLVGTRDPEVEPEVVQEVEPFRLLAVWRDRDGALTGGMAVNWPRESVRLRTTLRSELARRSDERVAS